MRNLLIAVTVLLAACSPYSYKPSNQSAPLDLSKEGFASNMRVVDDPLETKAKVTSKYGYRMIHSNGVVYDDNFLRAYIDKSTGETYYQVYDRVYMNDWSFYNQVNYKSGGDVKAQEVVRVSSDVERCSSVRELGCRLREDIAWKVSRELLDEIAATYTTVADRNIWEYRLKAQQGRDITRMFFAAEVAAFVEAVDDYRVKQGLITPNTP